MEDNQVFVYPDDGDISDSGSSQKSDTYIRGETVPARERAKSARELVKSQEGLVDMLENMRSDLSKMDREASRLKEDIIKSRQMFEIVVRKQDARDVLSDSNGYNIAHALPTVRYSTPTPRQRRQFSCSGPYTTDVRPVSVSSGGTRSRRGPSVSSRHSGTESEFESQDDWHSITTAKSDGNSTGSVESEEDDAFENYVNRRSSYFFTNRNPVIQSETSDDGDVEL